MATDKSKVGRGWKKATKNPRGTQQHHLFCYVHWCLLCLCVRVLILKKGDGEALSLSRDTQSDKVLFTERRSAQRQLFICMRSCLLPACCRFYFSNNVSQLYFYSCALMPLPRHISPFQITKRRAQRRHWLTQRGFFKKVLAVMIK